MHRTKFYWFRRRPIGEKPTDRPASKNEYEISDAVGLLIESGRTIDAIPLDGWRMDIGYPEDRDEAERRLADEPENVEADA